MYLYYSLFYACAHFALVLKDHETQLYPMSPIPSVLFERPAPSFLQLHQFPSFLEQFIGYLGLMPMPLPVCISAAFSPSFWLLFTDYSAP